MSMRAIDRHVIAADASGRRIDMLLGKTPDGTKTFAMRHQDVGTITGILADTAIDHLVAMLVQARGGMVFSGAIAGSDMQGGDVAFELSRDDDGAAAFGVRHRIGIITAIVTDDDLDEMIAELQALRAET